MSEQGDQGDKPAERPACANCGKPAIVLFGDYPACVDCKYKVEMGEWMQFTKHAAMLNLAAQEMDAIVGIGPAISSFRRQS